MPKSSNRASDRFRNWIELAEEKTRIALGDLPGELAKTGQKRTRSTSWVLRTYVARIEAASLPWCGYHLSRAAESS
jgi:hypothetical protein